VASGGVGEQAADLAGCGAEELAMLVDLVDRPVGERSMEAAFQADGVVAEDEGVVVEAEGHGGVAEFADAVHRFQPSGHADLDDLVAEGTDVADDVDVSGAGVRGARVDGGDVRAEAVEVCA
jgi:hypothetical protein